MNRILLMLLAALFLWFFFLKSEKVILGPGVMAAQAPLQEKPASARSVVIDDYVITPLARFKIRAKVLSKEEYGMGREADLSPVDLALGWGRMSDEEVLKSISISQSGRWYRWQTDTFPIPRREIEKSSANMHMIPGNKQVESILSKVREGHIVSIHGHLVQVMAKDGWHWVSSLSRDDTGSGACELILVESLEIENFQ